MTSRKQYDDKVYDQSGHHHRRRWSVCSSKARMPRLRHLSRRTNATYRALVVSNELMSDENVIDFRTVIPIRLRWWWRRHLPRQSRCSTVESVGIGCRWLATWHVALYAVGHRLPMLVGMRLFPSVPLAVLAELDTTVQSSSRRRDPPSILSALVAKDWRCDTPSRTAIYIPVTPPDPCWKRNCVAQSPPGSTAPYSRTFLTCSSYRHFVSTPFQIRSVRANWLSSRTTSNCYIFFLYCITCSIHCTFVLSLHKCLFFSLVAVYLQLFDLTMLLLTQCVCITPCDDFNDHRMRPRLI